MFDVAKIKIELVQELRKLTGRAVRIDKDLSELGDDDWSEQAIEAENDEVLEEIGESTVQEIKQIKLALEQIDAGKYGVCSSCERPIAEERMRALPSATLCVKCA